MESVRVLLAVGFVGLLLCGCPDLVVTSLTPGDPTVNAAGSVELPVTVVVRNQGEADAGPFKVSLHYTDAFGNFVVAFTVPGQNNIWYPSTTLPLPPDAEVTFGGLATFHSSVREVTVSMTAVADSCSGDEFMPSYCRVQESNEGNNTSAPQDVALP